MLVLNEYLKISQFLVFLESIDMSVSKLQEIVKGRKTGVLQSTVSQRVGHDWVTE